MSFLSEINILMNLVREYYSTIGGVEGNRIQHFGESAINKLRAHDLNLSLDEQEILMSALNHCGQEFELTRIRSLLQYPLE